MKLKPEERNALDRLNRIAAEVADGVRGELGDSIGRDVHLVRRMLMEETMVPDERQPPTPEETHVGADPEPDPEPEPTPES